MSTTRWFNLSSTSLSTSFAFTVSALFGLVQAALAEGRVEFRTGVAVVGLVAAPGATPHRRCSKRSRATPRRSAAEPQDLPCSDPAKRLPCCYLPAASSRCVTIRDTNREAANRTR